MWVDLAIECILFCVIPLPWTRGYRVFNFNNYLQQEIYYHVNEFLTLIMIVRILFIIRTIFTQSIWYSNRTQRVCNLYACEANYMFVIKSLMRTQPYQVIFTAMISMIFIFGYAVRICESPLVRITGPAGNDLSLYLNTMWNIIITMTTVGYGDLFTRSDIGRAVIFLVCICGIFITSMMVVTLTNSLNTTSLEGKAITVLERLEVREEMINLAGLVITLFCRTAQGWKRGTLNSLQLQEYLIKLRKAMNAFKTTVRIYKSIQDQSSINEEMTREFDFLKQNFKEVMEEQQKLVQLNEEILTKVQSLGNNQQIITEEENIKTQRSE